MPNSKNNRRKTNTKKVRTERPYIKVVMNGNVAVPYGNVSSEKAIGMMKQGIVNLMSANNARYINYERRLVIKRRRENDHK